MNSFTRSELAEGWMMVLAAAAGVMVTSFYIYSLGVFIQPLERAFGWGRSEISAATSIAALVGLVAYPLVGLAIDRWGARKVAIPGLVCYCVVLSCLGLSGPEIWTWWLAAAVITVTQIAAGPTVWASGVANRFRGQRGLALGLTLAGGGLSAALVPSLANALISAASWPTAYLVLGGVAAALALPLVVFAFRETRTVGAAPKVGLEIRQAVVTGEFFKLALAILTVATAGLGLIVHFVPMVSAAGISRELAAAIAGLIGLFSIVGRIAGGWLLDKCHARIIGAAIYLLPVIAAGSLFLVPQQPLLCASIAAIALGLALGGEMDIIAYCTSRYFGSRRYGFLFAAFVALMSVGTGIGPLLGGIVYDRTGQYDLLLIIAGVLSLSGSLLMLSLGQYREFQETAVKPDASLSIS